MQKKPPTFDDLNEMQILTKFDADQRSLSASKVKKFQILILTKIRETTLLVNLFT